MSNGMTFDVISTDFNILQRVVFSSLYHKRQWHLCNSDPKSFTSSSAWGLQVCKPIKMRQYIQLDYRDCPSEWQYVSACYGWKPHPQSWALMRAWGPVPHFSHLTYPCSSSLCTRGLCGVNKALCATAGLLQAFLSKCFFVCVTSHSVFYGGSSI